VVDLPEPDCWLHPDVEIRPSPIAGLGLFATASVTAGTVVSRVGGRLVSTTELRDMLAAAATDPGHSFIDTIAVTETRQLVLPPRRPNGYGNHSCDPNLWWVDAYQLAARRHITAGEEVTNDYATSTGDDEFTMVCSCRTAYCRDTITGQDWRLPDLHRRYGDHWVPVLRARIRRFTEAAERAVQPGP
jgi:SET domain-containing protein